MYRASIKAMEIKRIVLYVLLCFNVLLYVFSGYVKHATNLLATWTNSIIYFIYTSVGVHFMSNSHYCYK